MEKTGRVLDTNPFMISILAREWEDVDLVKVVEEAVLKAVMKPEYAK